MTTITITIDGHNSADVKVNGIEQSSNSYKKTDTKYYSNGVNGLSLEDSSTRAADRIATYYGYTPYTTIHNSIYESCYRLIEGNYGRDFCYKTFGAINALKRDYDYYKGIPNHVVFSLVASNQIGIPHYEYKA